MCSLTLQRDTRGTERSDLLGSGRERAERVHDQWFVVWEHTQTKVDPLHGRTADCPNPRLGERGPMVIQLTKVLVN